MNESRALADALSAATFAELPDEVVASAQRAVLDWWGVTVAGGADPSVVPVRQWVEGWGPGEATLLGVDGAPSVSAAAAALANGVAAHVLELDDLHPASTLHPGAPIIAAALAVAERQHASGAAFLLGVVVGFEAALRIGEAVNPSHYRYWHPTGTVATFGAAVAAGSLLGLGAGAMLDALGTAGSQAAGLWEFNADGAMTKPLHAGKAAFNGLLAADLAARGFSGASRILEGARGFFKATAEGADPSRITDGLGRSWKIGEDCFKLHACCGHTHTALDALLSLRPAGPLPPPVESIEIETYANGLAVVGERRPGSVRQAQFSMVYAAALAWLEGAAGREQFDRFSPELAPAMAALMDRIQVRAADDLTRRYPAQWPARVRVSFADGTSLVKEVAHPRGSPRNPPTARELDRDLATKFRRLVGGGEPGASALLQSLAAIPAAPDMRALVQKAAHI